MDSTIEQLTLSSITSGDFTLISRSGDNFKLNLSGAITSVISSNNLSIFGSTTSSQFGGIISDKTGTGNAVFSDNPLFSTAIRIPNGTVGAPSVAFNSDADGSGTGLYRVSANTVGVACNGTLIMSISSSGADISGAPVVTTTNTATLTNKKITPRVSSAITGSTINIDSDSYDCYTITGLMDDTTISITGSPTNFQKLLVRIKDNGISRTITWNPANINNQGSTPVTATTTSKTHTIGFIYNAETSMWGCIFSAVEA